MGVRVATTGTTDEITVTVSADVLQVFPIGDFDVTVSASAPSSGHPPAGPAMTGATVRPFRGFPRGDSGPLEMVILLPAVLLLFGLVVAFGRTTTAATNVEHAAAVGAGAAVAAQTAGGADARANVVVSESLAGSGSCRSQDTSVTGSFTPGGRVTVSVSCVVALGDVTRFGFLPGSRTLTASATEVIDRTRGGA